MTDESSTAARILCLQEEIERLHAENERYKILFGQISAALALGNMILTEWTRPAQKPDA